MGKTDGFLLYERMDSPARKADERIRDFNEIYCDLKEEERKKQAGRCMNCGVPFCQSAIRLKNRVTGCPLHNLIPEWNDEIWLGNYEHALARLLKTNPFPEFTGRVCPALCEKACVNGIDSDPVTVHDNERFLIEYAFAHGLIKAEPPAVRTGRKAAVVGSGPAGLAAAQRLNRRGHSVTVYERDDRIGGLLMYGIPSVKLDKSVIERRRKILEEEGIRFMTGVNVGKDITLAQLDEEYDAVVLACGAKQARKPQIEGMNKDNSVYAVDFLGTMTKALLAGNDPDETYPVKDKNVIILGGGDTGNDCLGACIRRGAKAVVQIEMMPKLPEERQEDNPWPQWPNVLKTDYGQQEAIAVYGKDPRIFSTTVTELITGEDGSRKALTAGITFNDGHMEISSDTAELPCDLLIIAAGFIGCETDLPASYDIPCTKRSTVATAIDSFATGKKGFFTAGDMHTGQSLVVQAISEGRRCAREADAYLMGYTNLV